MCTIESRVFVCECKPAKTQASSEDSITELHRAIKLFDCVTILLHGLPFPTDRYTFFLRATNRRVALKPVPPVIVCQSGS